MPVGRFVGVALVAIDTRAASGEIWIGGMPDALLLDEHGMPVERFKSANLPLGIVDSMELDLKPTHFSWQRPGQLCLCSDGLLEACDGDGKQFEEAGLLAAIAGESAGGRRDAVQNAISQHMGTAAAQDDISLLLLTCPAPGHP